jgi:Leucine rich repeat
MSSSSKKNIENARRFLWEDEDTGSIASSRTRNSAAASAATGSVGFSTRDYTVDQSVNLMDIRGGGGGGVSAITGIDGIVGEHTHDVPLGSGSNHHARGGATGSTRLSGGPAGASISSRVSGAVAGLFRSSTSTTGGPDSGGKRRASSHFDEYGDAAASTESEEYISEKQRRRLGPVWSSVMNAWNSAMDALALSCLRLGVGNGKRGPCSALVCLLLAACLGGGAIYLAISSGSGSSGSGSTISSSISSDDPNVQHRFENLRNRIIRAQVTPSDVLDNTSSPQRKALEWAARDDPNRHNIPSDHEAMMDRYALAVLYFSSGNAPSTESTASTVSSGASAGSWNKADRWMSEKGICSWYGVECEPREQEATAENNFTPVTHSYDDNARVTALMLSENKIEGVIPAELAAMEKLITIDLQNNAFSHTIPSAIGKLTELRDLLLRQNSIVGSIPKELGAIPRLHQLVCIVQCQCISFALFQLVWSLTIFLLLCLSFAAFGIE